MKFRFLRDPLFLVCVAVYFVNRCAEGWGYGCWWFSCYLNDLICLGFWMPIVVWTLRVLRLRAGESPPLWWEMMTAFVVWSVMFEMVLPFTRRFAGIAVSDPWDVFCYAVGGVGAYVWWHREEIKLS